MLCRLTQDDARSVTAKNDMAGMSFALNANTNYSFEFHLMFTSNAATVGVQFALTFGGTITNLRAVALEPAIASPHTFASIGGVGPSPVNFNFTASQGTGASLAIITGTIEVGASGGTLQLQHGSETATLTTVLRGSYGVCVAH